MNQFERRVGLPLFFVAGFAFLIAGCWSQGTPKPENKTKNTKVKTTKSSEPSKPKVIVEGWEKPAVALILTGEQKGYMEPCGCSETQSGGISRRFDLFRQLREDKGWETVGIELGDLVKRSRTQDRIKYGVMYEALVEMGYAAMSLGPGDLQLPVDQLYSLVPTSNEPSTALPFVSSNVVFYGSKDLGTPAHYKVIERNGVKIGVTGVFGEKFAKSMFPEGSAANGLLSVENPTESLKSAMEKLKAENCDILLLLAQAPADETEKLVSDVPGFDLCLSAGGAEDPNGIPQTVGNTLVLEVGRKGKYAGVLGYYPEAEKKFQFELVDLDKERFKRTEEMEAQMALYQELLKQQDVIGNEAAAPHPSGNTFVGAETCGRCHTKAFEKWKSSKHSHATETLLKGREGYNETPWISRIHDPECLCCHTVGWNPQEVFRYEGGFTSLEETPHLFGQGCENCHGPGSHHTELENEFEKTRMSTPEVVAARQAIKVDLVTAEKKVCVKCHDYENSPKFNFTKYWDKVIHRGKD